jgi:hypothetical protein
MTRLRGRARRGARLKAQAPFGRWGTQTFIAGLRSDRLTAPFVIEGPIDRNAFNAYVETQLAPSLQPGDIVILDNLSVHKSAKAGRHSRSRRLAAVPAAILPGPEPHRDGIRKAQGASAQDGSSETSTLSSGHRRRLQPVRSQRVLELLQGRRICVRLSARCSRLSIVVAHFRAARRDGGRIEA